MLNFYGSFFYINQVYRLTVHHGTEELIRYRLHQPKRSTGWMQYHASVCWRAIKFTCCCCSCKLPSPPSPRYCRRHAVVLSVRFWVYPKKWSPTMGISLAVSTQYTNVTDRHRTMAQTALMHSVAQQKWLHHHCWNNIYFMRLRLVHKCVISQRKQKTSLCNVYMCRVNASQVLTREWPILLQTRSFMLWYLAVLTTATQQSTARVWVTCVRSSQCWMEQRDSSSESESTTTSQTPYVTTSTGCPCDNVSSTNCVR